MNLKDSFLKVYDRVFYNIYTIMKGVYKDRELKIFYSIYTILFFQVLLVIVPIHLLINRLISPLGKVGSYLIIGALVLIFYKFHSIRYSEIEKLKLISKVKVSSLDWLLFASIIIAWCLLLIFLAFNKLP